MKSAQHAALLALVLATSHASAQDDAWQTWIPEREISSVRMHIDNDLFAVRNLDRDYTGGLAITLSGTAARDGRLSLDPLVTRTDELLERAPAASVRHARQVGLIAFTPMDLVSEEAQQADRPYASLLFASNGRVRVDGYDHRISAGGELTARYMLARQNLWYADPAGHVEVKTTVQGSVGFLTETSAAMSMRIGRVDTPWWSFAPELADYVAAPTPTEAFGFQREMYFFAGARVTARAYNALLQGQFRHSDVRYSYSEVEPIVAKAWIGVMTQLFPNTDLSYTLYYQTAELRDGKGARDAYWGGVQVTYSF
jgi:hypothetical protein